MMERKRGWTDEQVEQVVGNLLRIGVLLAAGVVLAGGVIYLARHGRQPVPDRHEFKPVPADPITVVDNTLSGHSQGVIQVGLLLLVATPVARVIFSAFAFLRQHDTTYVVVTLIVLAVLLYSLFSSRLAEL